MNAAIDIIINSFNIIKENFQLLSTSVLFGFIIIPAIAVMMTYIKELTPENKK